MKYLLLILLSFNAVAAFTVNQQITGSITSASTKVLEPNANRNYLLIINTGAASASVKLNSAHVASEGVSIPAGGSWEPEIAPNSSVYIKAFSGNSSYSIIEGVQ